jgi:hypothetical protein
MRLEKETGQTLPRLGFLLQIGRGGVHIMTCMLWAALEGGRLRTKSNRPAMTVDEVADLVDATDGGMADVWREPDDGTRPVFDAEQNPVMEGGKQKRERNPEIQIVEAHPVFAALQEAFKAAFPKEREGDKALADPR